MTDFSTYKFRCHALGQLMTTSRDAITPKQLQTIAEFERKPKLTDKQQDELLRLIAKRDASQKNRFSVLGDTCINYLVQVYVQERYGRENEIHSKTIEKGLAVEEDSLTLLSLVNREWYEKNNTRLENDYFTGIPDTFKGQSITFADRVTDIKSKWDLFTFFDTKVNGIPDAHEDQINGYCDLTAAVEGSIANCLVNAPAHMVTEEKKRVYFRMNCPDETNAEYIDAMIRIEKSMIFDMPRFRKQNPGFDFHCRDWKWDIPMEERLHEVFVKRDDELISQMKKRVVICREWLNDFAEKQEKKLAHAA